jgi:hypothetical protein
MQLIIIRDWFGWIDSDLAELVACFLMRDLLEIKIGL